jgi:hypothetical protein
MHGRAGEDENQLHRSNNVMKTRKEELRNLKVLLRIANHHQNAVIYLRN